MDACRSRIATLEVLVHRLQAQASVLEKEIAELREKKPDDRIVLAEDLRQTVDYCLDWFERRDQGMTLYRQGEIGELKSVWSEAENSPVSMETEFLVRAWAFLASIVEELDCK